MDDARAEQWRLRCQEVGTRYAAAAARAAELEAQLARERATVARMLGSRSWRLTEPLRRLRGRETPAPPTADDPFEVRMRAAYDARTASWPQPLPRTFNEKVWHRRLVDRRPVLRIYSDKVAALDHAARALPAEFIPERLAVVGTAEELRALDLPAEYVVKASHASGGSAVVWHGPGSRGQDWGHPWIRKAYDAAQDPRDLVAADLTACLSHDYGWDMLEWGYFGVPRRLLVDTLYRGPDGGLPADLRCYTFHGRVQCIEMASDRQRESTRYASWHDRDWNVLPIHTKLADRPHDRPPGLDDAVAAAEVLAADEDFVRVDFLITGEGLKFLELTAYSHAGNAQFQEQSSDEFLGSLW